MKHSGFFAIFNFLAITAYYTRYYLSSFFLFIARLNRNILPEANHAISGDVIRESVWEGSHSFSTLMPFFILGHLHGLSGLIIGLFRA